MHKFYFRFKPIFIDNSDEKEIVKYNQVLHFFDELSPRFSELKKAYDNNEKNRADIIVNVLPDICGVTEISVYHKIKFKLFSKVSKQNVFSICIEQYAEDDSLSLFFYDTADFNEMKQIFSDFINEYTLPDLSKWQRTCIK